MNTLSYKTKSISNEAVEKNWYVIDAENQVLGRLASTAAKVIRGKHKPTFTPHIDCGDQVIIINAAKVKMTGNKLDKKEILRHTGYPGGQRSQTPREVLKKYPVRLVEIAVRGMLPKNRLGRKIFHNLFVYADASHPHEAQKPQELKIK